MTSFSGDQSIFLFLSFEPIVFAVQPTLTQFFNPLSINSLFWVFWAQAHLPFGFYWRKKRECSGPIGILPTQVQARLWCQYKAKIVSIGRLGIEKDFRHCKEPRMGKAGAQLGGAISHHLGGWYRSIFPRRPRWACNTTSLECKQPENVLLLMKVSFVIYLSIA